MNYYFLVSSLPMLQLGLKPPIDLTAFLSVCEQNLLPEDLAVLRDLLAADSGHSDHPFSREWREREVEIRNEIARLRARHRPPGTETWRRPQRDIRLYVQLAVEEAFQEANPLERERELDQLRWRVLDELAGLNPFSIEAVFAYGLRLRLVCRWTAFNAEAGRTLLEHTIVDAAKLGEKRLSGFNPQKAVSA